ncbi:MAG: polyprenyl synthetase family protein, partial [Alphaproteobacteria bacterium]
MDGLKRINAALETALAYTSVKDAPPKLASALRHAVFPGGARVRPLLCLSVAQACGDDTPDLSEAAACAVELLHCASLVHDDLPCFDDADTRRGRPSVHRAYGEPLAVLAGDGLIVLAFETLARAGVADPARLVPLLLTIGGAVGMPHGITAGQAWESEPDVKLETYQRAKTGALFAAATMVGAAAAGVDPAPWRTLGAKIGEAYQVADDILD